MGWKIKQVLYVDDTFLLAETREWGRSLKVNTGKSKVMLLGEEEGLECEVCAEGIRLEHVA